MKKWRVWFVGIEVVPSVCPSNIASHPRTSSILFIIFLRITQYNTSARDTTKLENFFFEHKVVKLWGNFFTNLGPTHLLYKTNSGLQAHSHMWPSRPASLSKSVKPQETVVVSFSPAAATPNYQSNHGLVCRPRPGATPPREPPSCRIRRRRLSSLIPQPPPTLRYPYRERALRRGTVGRGRGGDPPRRRARREPRQGHHPLPQVNFGFQYLLLAIFSSGSSGWYIRLPCLY